MNKRFKSIINMLQSQEYVTSFQFAEKLKVSDRTIRSDFRELNEFIEDQGAFITSSPSKGYKLEIEDNQLFKELLDSFNDETLPENSEERITYLLRYFLQNPSYVKIEDLCELLYVSKSTLQQDLKAAKEVLAEYGLELKQKPNYGLKIDGKEFDFRLCLTNFTMQHMNPKDNEFDDNEQLILSLKSSLTKILSEEQYEISNFSFNNLVMHLLVAMKRIEQKCFVTMDKKELSHLKTKDEYKVAKRIVDACSDLTGLEIPESECGYITIHLTGKQNLNAYASNHENIIIDKNTQEIVDDMLNRIYDTYRVDFRDNLDLRMTLYLHLVPLLNRIKYNLTMKNPLREEILRHYPLAYQFAKEACIAIENKYNRTISDDETCYFALHLNLALEQQRVDTTMKNVLVVCSTGKGTSELLAYRIRSQFKESLNKVTPCDLLGLHKIDFSTYHYIFATVPIDFPVPLPIIQIEYFFQNDDIAKIKKIMSGNNVSKIDKYFSKDLFYTDITGKTKEEVLKKIVNRVDKVKEIPSTYFGSILEREALAVTEFGNYVAIPHPNVALSKETFVCVTILKEPIVWQKTKVQFIFLLSIEKDGTEDLRLFYETTSKMLMSENNVKMLINAKDFDIMLGLLRRIEEEVIAES
ncbi:BglG family transcription antiterminator [Anaerorhabdus furcosa]|uniref:Lichenan operon transcriptional antiterminator n=1 Tax=Anaerorhabdus furcosa TaxID=118967 RepID=A0A1T4PYA1_9FIRM|nr:BglG family transcription antiterminator [Anaerorhabdus furcosa]SJZ96297.1 lichenan operon transcriptional antiterminator [Anaerorhabdus furcosa]